MNPIIGTTIGTFLGLLLAAIIIYQTRTISRLKSEIKRWKLSHDNLDKYIEDIIEKSRGRARMLKKLWNKKVTDLEDFEDSMEALGLKFARKKGYLKKPRS